VTPWGARERSALVRIAAGDLLVHHGKQDVAAAGYFPPRMKTQLMCLPVIAPV